MIEERTQPTGAYILYNIYIYFIQYFYSLISPFGIPITYNPAFWHFHDSHSRPHFATHIRDHVLRLLFATPVRDSQLRLAIFCRDFCRATPALMDGLC